MKSIASSFPVFTEVCMPPLFACLCSACMLVLAQPHPSSMPQPQAWTKLEAATAPPAPHCTHVNYRPRPAPWPRSSWPPPFRSEATIPAARACMARHACCWAMLRTPCGPPWDRAALQLWRTVPCSRSCWPGGPGSCVGWGEASKDQSEGGGMEAGSVVLSLLARWVQGDLLCAFCAWEVESPFSV